MIGVLGCPQTEKSTFQESFHLKGIKVAEILGMKDFFAIALSVSFK